MIRLELEPEPQAGTERVLIRIGEPEIRQQEVGIGGAGAAADFRILIHARHLLLVEDVKQIGHEFESRLLPELPGVLGMQVEGKSPVGASEGAARPYRNLSRIQISADDR